MSEASKSRILYWIVAVGVAGIFLIISSWFTTKEVNPNRTTILVNAPEKMVAAFQSTFRALELDEDYVIEATDDVAKANFVVKEGMSREGKLIAYSPIVAVFNNDSEYRECLKEKNIFVTSEVESDEDDFDFNKVIQEALSGNECEFKVYYPSKDSDTWEEFYHFMLFTVNDGYYPSTVKEMENAKQVVDEFLNSKYAEPFNNNSIDRSNGIAKNSIYFMAWADLVRVQNQTGGFSARVMYPKTVVYHSYYATYDELGKVLYDALDEDYDGPLFFNENNVGYYYLRNNGYNTKYNKFTSIPGQVYGNRTTFNGVKIPGAEINIHDEEVNNNE